MIATAQLRGSHASPQEGARLASRNDSLATGISSRPLHAAFSQKAAVHTAAALTAKLGGSCDDIGDDDTIAAAHVLSSWSQITTPQKRSRHRYSLRSREHDSLDDSLDESSESIPAVCISDSCGSIQNGSKSSFLEGRPGALRNGAQISDSCGSIHKSSCGGRYSSVG